MKGENEKKKTRNNLACTQRSTNIFLVIEVKMVSTTSFLFVLGLSYARNFFPAGKRQQPGEIRFV